MLTILHRYRDGEQRPISDGTRPFNSDSSTALQKKKGYRQNHAAYEIQNANGNDADGIFTYYTLYPIQRLEYVLNQTFSTSETQTRMV